jgi:gamma-glutamyltranspeptidase/glutathione hydrolase
MCDGVVFVATKVAVSCASTVIYDAVTKTQIVSRFAETHWNLSSPKEGVLELIVDPSGYTRTISLVKKIRYSRREMLARTGKAALAGAIGFPAFSFAQKASPQWSHGAVVGENTAAVVGEQVLGSGGNAVDAAVAGALMACIAAPARSGIGGYGGHMVIARADRPKVTAIDFNTAAPAAAHADMFPLDEKGAVKGKVNFYGWQAVGVPGVLAGLQLALDRYGTRSFRELVQPSIDLANKGFVINKVFANTIRSGVSRFSKDAGSAQLYLKNGQPLEEGDILRNPELAKMLETLAQRNSVDSFYRGDIAQQIAEAFQTNGGLVTSKDLASYQAREVEPISFHYRKAAVFTAPLTAAGLVSLEALSILSAMDVDGLESPGARAHAALEALRLAWKDRLELFGDPDHIKVPVEKLLSSAYGQELAKQAMAAVKQQKAIITGVPKHTDEGTNNICAVDTHGNIVTVTLTHGSGFGAQVTVDGLGLTLGHGMSRFDPHPGHPNAPGPGKRPVHNMCPSVVLRNGKPVLGVGAAGGVRIPNCVYDVLRNYLFQNATMEQGVADPRVQCTGTLDVAIEPFFPKDIAQYLKQVGFKVGIWESSAVVSAVSFDPRNGASSATIRAPAALGMNLKS